MTTQPTGIHRQSTTQRLQRCGIIAGPAFTASFLINGLTEPGYDPLRHPVSSLALGPHGWVQSATFEGAGLLYLAFALGLARTRRGTRTGPWGAATFIAAAAIGLVGAGLFHTDPFSGYPPGTPDAHTTYTAIGALHDALSVPTFLGIPAAAIAYAWWFHRRQHPGWATYCLVTGLLFVAGFALTSAAFNQAPALVAYGGLLQRTTVTIGFTWLTLLAIHNQRQPEPANPTSSPLT